MTLNPKKSPALAFPLCACLALAAASFINLWRPPVAVPSFIQGKLLSCSLWQAVEMSLEQWRAGNHDIDDHIAGHAWNFKTAIIVLLIGVVAGYVPYRAF